MAIRAEQTGHLVLSTVHTKSALATLMRLNQLGLSDRDVAESVTLILAQRLLRVLCNHCKVPAGTPIVSSMPRAEDDCFQANLAGCEHCVHGYWGAREDGTVSVRSLGSRISSHQGRQREHMIFATWHCNAIWPARLALRK